jgi:hypothetical protein
VHSPICPPLRSGDIEADAFFVPERRARTPRAISVTNSARNELAEWEAAERTRARRRKERDQRRHDQMVEAIVCCAVHRHLTCPDGATAVSLGRERRSRYEPEPYAPMKRLLTALGPDGLGLLSVTWGTRPEQGRGFCTTFAAAPRLIAAAGHLTLADFGRRPGAEPIVLRQVKGNVASHGPSDEIGDWFKVWAETGAEVDDLVSYADCAIADQLRDEIDQINAKLDNADIALAPWARLDLRQVDVGDRWLRRVFNNGHGDFRHGGRLAGGFWTNLPKKIRRSAILLDGERVVELDYRAMMPRLLYAHAGHPFPPDHDPYSIAGIPSEHRDGVKTYFSSLLFGRTALTRWPRGCRQKFPKGTLRAEVLDRLRRQHHFVAGRFGSFIGFELLRRESDILVDVLGTCLRRGITVLPIHDAVLCPSSKIEEVKTVMMITFQSATGAIASVSTSMDLRGEYPIKE